MTVLKQIRSRIRGLEEREKSKVYWIRCAPLVFSAPSLLMKRSQIQPDMIALDPEFVGSLAPEPKLTTAVNETHDIPFARLPRLERLRVSGKADETEETDDEPGGDDEADGKAKKPLTKAEKEKKKMRGKNKSLKRSVHSSPDLSMCYNDMPCRYLRKQRKNVIDPKAVSTAPFSYPSYCSTYWYLSRLLSDRSWRKNGRNGKKLRLLLGTRANRNQLLWIGSRRGHDVFIRCIVYSSRAQHDVRWESIEFIECTRIIQTFEWHRSNYDTDMTFEQMRYDIRSILSNHRNQEYRGLFLR